jgi:hypothetical protein
LDVARNIYGVEINEFTLEARRLQFTAYPLAVLPSTP